MWTWIVEADIYRLRKAIADADAAGRARLIPHLRRAEAHLRASRPADRAQDADLFPAA